MEVLLRLWVIRSLPSSPDSGGSSWFLFLPFLFNQKPRDNIYTPPRRHAGLRRTTSQGGKRLIFPSRCRRGSRGPKQAASLWTRPSGCSERCGCSLVVSVENWGLPPRTLSSGQVTILCPGGWGLGRGQLELGWPLSGPTAENRVIAGDGDH